jgi:hypothetical protein
VVVRAQGHVTSQVDIDTRDLFGKKNKGQTRYGATRRDRTELERAYACLLDGFVADFELHLDLVAGEVDIAVQLHPHAQVALVEHERLPVGVLHRRNGPCSGHATQRKFDKEAISQIV